MKKIFATLGVLIMISGVVLAGGIENPSTTSNSAIVKTADGVKVFYKSEKAVKVSVAIFNQEGRKIFSEEVKNHSSFIRPYNLSNLPEGDYRIVLEDENGTNEKTVNTIKSSAPVLATVINARKEYNKCMVALFSKGNAQVTVRLRDKHQNELAVESYSINGQSAKLFNLQDFKGAISVEVSDKNGILKSITL